MKDSVQAGRDAFASVEAAALESSRAGQALEASPSGAESSREPVASGSEHDALDCLTRQLQRLQNMADELARASSSARVIEVAVRHGVAAFGAKSGAFHALDPGESAEKLAARRAQGSGSGQELGGTRALVPIVIDGSTRGHISLSFAEPREFVEHERRFLSLLALQCAEALRRAEALEQEERRSRQLGILTEAGALLDRTLDYEATLENVARMAMPDLADVCMLSVRDDEGTRRVWQAHDNPEAAALLSRTGWLPERLERAVLDENGSRPALQPELDRDWPLELTHRPEQLELLRELDLCSLISVPLFCHGRRLGALTLCYRRSHRRHTPADLAIAEELSRRAAQALHQARLHMVWQRTARRAEEAARQAEEASRLRDEFLSTVSHELRTPLSAILGWATLLRRERDTTPAALDRGLEVIERNARAQQRIVEDILDASRMVCGKLRIKNAPLDLRAIAGEVCDSLRYAACARRVELVLNAPGGPYRMLGDADRLRQILWNLLSNAVKFTPGGGTVELEMSRRGDQIGVTVRDTGNGIDPAFLPFVFKYFRQADGTTTRVHGGLGLGLAIVRDLVEMHGGTVMAESEGAGKGATFTVTLPVGADFI